MTDNIDDDLDLTSLVDALGVSVTDIPIPEGVWDAALDAAFSAPEGAGDSSTVPEMDDEPDVPADDSDDEVIVDDDSDDSDDPDSDDGPTDSHHHDGGSAHSGDDVDLGGDDAPDDSASTGSHETAEYHDGIYDHDTGHDAGVGHTDV